MHLVGLYTYCKMMHGACNVRFLQGVCKAWIHDSVEFIIHVMLMLHVINILIVTNSHVTFRLIHYAEIRLL